MQDFQEKNWSGTGILVPVDLKTGLIESASIGVGVSPGVVTIEFGKTSAVDMRSIIEMPNPGRQPTNDLLYLHHAMFKIKAIKAIQKLYNESRK